MLRVTFIKHSSFLVETQDAYILFDYFQGDIPPLDADKPLYVLNSHFHEDHYLPVIFTLPQQLQHRNVRFLLSNDILNTGMKDVVHESEQITFLAPHDFFEDKRLSVATLASNDEGVAFWCNVSGYKIYHAGDLNNWFWEGDDEDRDRARRYHGELERLIYLPARDSISNDERIADVAFIPLDPRLDKAFPSEQYLREFPIHENTISGFIQPKPSEILAFALGIEDFMQYADAKAIFPMHMWEKFDVIDWFKALPEVASYSDRVIQLRSENQVVTLDL